MKWGWWCSIQNDFKNVDFKFCWAGQHSATSPNCIFPGSTTLMLVYSDGSVIQNPGFGIWNCSGEMGLRQDEQGFSSFFALKTHFSMGHFQNPKPRFWVPDPSLSTPHSFSRFSASLLLFSSSQIFNSAGYILIIKSSKILAYFTRRNYLLFD